MPRRASHAATLVVALLVVTPLLAGLPPRPATAQAGVLRAGAAAVDSAWHVGSAAGQYAGKNVGTIDYHNDNGVDPNTHSLSAEASYGIQGRESVRALVVEGSNGERFAIVSNDLYISQDVANRRVSQLLAQHDQEVALGLEPGPPTGITNANLAISVSHSHSSPYYSSTTWGPWLFEDVFDLRYFDHITRRMADAVIAAAADLRPVRIGASQSEFRYIKKHSYGPTVADDGTPAGYRIDDIDRDLTVLAVDDATTGDPVATWVVWGEHPEMLDGNDLLASEWVNTMHRYVDREAGGVTVFSQRDVGTSETARGAEHQDAQLRMEFDHREYAQVERAARTVADAVLMNRRAVAVGAAGVTQPLLRNGERLPRPHLVLPFAADLPVDTIDLSFAPPSTRVSPTVSNCRTEKAFSGNPGVPLAGVPDCEFAFGDQGTNPVFDALGVDARVTYDTLREAGVPIPDNYGFPSVTGLQETAAVHLQAFRLGEIAITVCPCEQWADQSRNIESRLDRVPDNLWYGWDWTANYTHPGFEQGVRYDGVDGPWQLPDEQGETWCIPLDADGNEVAEDDAELWRCRNPRYDRYVDLPPAQGEDQYLPPITDLEFRRWKARIYNDARGWDAPENSAHAESEPTDPADIWGNYTHEELHGVMAGGGYRLVLPISFSNDYWGYIASYLEFQNHDHYRKALTGLGPHSSDFLATRLTRMAATLRGGPTVEQTPKDLAYQAEIPRMEGVAQTIGNGAATYLPAYEAQLPPDGGLPAITSQPGDVQRFQAAQVSWIGGSNFTDTPHATVERCVASGCDPGDPADWAPYADGQGEVEVIVDFPQPEQLPLYRAGQYQWPWTATFEAYDADIPQSDDAGTVRRQTPAGTYRFVIDGCHRGLVPGLPNDPDAAPCYAHDPAGRVRPYTLISEPFEVTPWEGITATGLTLEDDRRVTFDVGPEPAFPIHQSNMDVAYDHADPQVRPLDYPDTYDSPFDFIGSEDEPVVREYAPGPADDERFCFHCSFRPWADTGAVDQAAVTVTRFPADSEEQHPATYDPARERWRSAVRLFPGDRAVVARAGVVDEFGEINGQPSNVVQVPLARVSVGDASVLEGSTGTRQVAVTVRLSEETDDPVTVQYRTVPDSAGPTDYLTSTGSLTTPAGQRAATLQLEVLGDSTVEPDERFLVELIAVTNAQLGRALGSVTILDDDTSPSLVPTVATGGVRVIEGDDGTTPATFTLSLSHQAAPGQPVTVTYVTEDGSARAPADYTSRSASVVIPAGQSSAQVAIDVLGDRTDEDDETFRLRLTGADGGFSVDPTRGVATGTIEDDDGGPTVSVRDLVATEGSGGGATPFPVEVRLQRASGRDITVRASTAPGTAADPDDFAGTSSIVTVPAGATSATLLVPVVADAINEDDETFTVALADATGATIADGQATVRIVDDDEPPLVAIGDASVREGNEGRTPLTFPLTLSAPSSREVTVEVTTEDGTADSYDDYERTDATVTFAPGETVASVTVPVIGDTVTEEDESLRLVVIGTTEAGVGDGTGRGTIVDDDHERVTRLAGETRVETATEVSRSSYPQPDSASAVVLARQDVFADGLAGTPLAVARDAPILLSFSDRLDERVASELDRVLAPGGRVYLLGQTVALGPAVEDAVRARGYDVVRLGGATRIETAVEIARDLGSPAALLLADGYRFPDALAAGPAAVASRGAILLTVRDQPHPATDGALAAWPSAQRVAVGGQAAGAYPSAEPVVGPTREETAVAVADRFFTDPWAVGVARRQGSGPEAGGEADQGFADALTGGAHVARRGGSMLISFTEQLHPAPGGWICAHAGTLTDAFVYGGEQALSAAVADEVGRRIAGQGC